MKQYLPSEHPYTQPKQKTTIARGQRRKILRKTIAMGAATDDSVGRSGHSVLTHSSVWFFDT
jgi:hypothetical protein